MTLRPPLTSLLLVLLVSGAAPALRAVPAPFRFPETAGLPPLPAGQAVRCVHRSPDGTWWAGTESGLLQVRNGAWTAPGGAVAGAPVTGLADGPDGRLWVASTAGLFVGGGLAAFQAVPGWEGGGVQVLEAGDRTLTLLPAGRRTFLSADLPVSRGGVPAWAWVAMVLAGGGLAGWVLRGRRTVPPKAPLPEVQAPPPEEVPDKTLIDQLTGLKNRRFLNVCMPKDVAHVQRLLRNAAQEGRTGPQSNTDLAFIMMDLDHFKAVNDQYGHAAGDRVLVRTAEVLRRVTRDTDTVIRWGGEEFLIVARNVTQSEIPVLVERIRSRVAEAVFEVGDSRSVRLTCSLGFAHYPFLHTDMELFSWERMVDLADHCLYTVKRGGRDAWIGIYPTESSDSAQLKQKLPFQISALLEAGMVRIRTSRPDAQGLDWNFHMQL